jgi:hypothetical protein
LPDVCQNAPKTIIWMHLPLCSHYNVLARSHDDLTNQSIKTIIIFVHPGAALDYG